jgi:lysyl-tRNA synthetase class 2
VPEQDDLVRQRQSNLEELAGLGLPYLPNRFGPTRSAEEIKQSYDALEGSAVCVAGRLMTVRVMGKASFAHIQDASGRIQLYFKRDTLGDQKYEYFKLLDLGDIVGARGTVFKTRTGEISIQVEDLVLLAKAYLPLPEKWHGLTDVETRYRRRYLDLISNEEARRILLLRSAVVRQIRRFLDARGYVEVETPILQPIYGGAAANPFTTHYESLDLDVFLRISDELYLKRLIVGGIDRVYEIGKDFRNEGISRKHSPEFTMLEFYQAYADYRDIMGLVETLVAAVAQETLGTTAVTVEGREINLTPPWRRLSMQDALLEHTGVDIYARDSRDQLLAAARERGVPVDPNGSRGKLVEELFSALVEPTLIEPTFVCDHPVDFPGSLLAKRSKLNPEAAERFEPYVGGTELGNGFTELNDPFDQERRMQEATRLRGEEHQQYDRDYIQALEHGMPPTGGFGIGIDRLTMLLAGTPQIRETILFPLLRPREADDAVS